MALLLKNARYIDPLTLTMTATDILVNEGDKGAILMISESNRPQENQIKQILDCGGNFVTKSFGVGHHHIYSALATGMPAPAVNPTNFHEILKYIWWKLDKSLTREMIESSALVTAIACAEAGSTFVIDHHASPNAIAGSLDIIASAFDKVGVSHLLCYEVTDRDGEKARDAGLEESNNYLRGRAGLVGLHAAFTVGDDTVEKAVAIMERHNSGIHIHVAEDMYDQTHSANTYKKRVVERLYGLGVLSSSKTILGHCLHLNDNEKKLISDSPAWVVQNCESNLNNNVGYFSGEGVGDRIMLGTDGMHSDMLRSAKASFFVGQNYDNIDYSGIYRRFRNVHRYLSENRFFGDAENNLVVLDYNPPTPLTSDNFLGHFLFGINASSVRDVISDGRIIVRDKKVSTVDADAIKKVAREHAAILWKEMGNLK